MNNHSKGPRWGRRGPNPNPKLPLLRNFRMFSMVLSPEYSLLRDSLHRLVCGGCRVECPACPVPVVGWSGLPLVTTGSTGYRGRVQSVGVGEPRRMIQEPIPQQCDRRIYSGSVIASAGGGDRGDRSKPPD
ncbi:hypothetical protein BO71DRAFT_81506 [Aspergillus ellipticus CBS 707.79]|uniref:Uncharacterized protein n=1 Tax=Aspergillus ellipticus CBS 707.79 TaxID=1448320 RepID=A0A319CZS8_9EURO|nr:hypothetical protein BO71DRAFT_81506 [Aspergillus ellipticus CBS 707.79]